MSSGFKNDATFGSIKVNDNLYLPNVNLNTKPPKGSGNFVYNVVDDSLYYCDALEWIPLGTVTNAANVGGGAELFRDKTGNILNFRTLVEGNGVNITQNANTVTIESTGGATNTFGVITGDGSGGDPIRVIDGTDNGNVLQWDDNTATWGLQNGLFTEYIFVDLNGSDANGEIFNPFRPFQTIAAALAEAVVYGAPITIYVRAGTHTCNTNLIAEDVNYYFSPNCVVECSVTPFSNPGVATSSFRVYGKGQFVCENASVVNITSNLDYLYIEGQSMTSLLGTAVLINLSTIEAHIKLEESVTSALGNAIELRGGTGNITADSSVGSTNGLLLASTDGTWTVNVRIITGTSGPGVTCNSSGQNSRIYADEISSSSTVALSHSSGTLYVHARRVRTPIATNAVQCSAGSLHIEGFEAIVTENSDSSLLISGGACTCIGQRIAGIFSSSGTGVCKVVCNLLDSPATGIYAICINTTSAINLEVYANAIAGINTPTIRNISSGSALMKIQCQSLSTTLAQPVFYGDCVNSTVYLDIQRVVSSTSTSTLFNFIEGNFFVEFQNISSVITSPLFVFDETAIVNVRGKSISTIGSVFSIPNTATTCNVTWDVQSIVSTTDTCFDILSTSAFTLNMRDSYGACTWNDVTGHVMTLVGGGTSVFKLFNCVFTKTNATAKILSAANPTNVLLYGFLTSNDTSTNITYQVGSNTVDALVV